MFIEDHQATFTFQVSHETCYTQMWRYLHKHVDVIRTGFCLYDLNPFSPAQCSQNLANICPDLFVDYLPSVL